MTSGGSHKPPEERVRTLLLRGDDVMKSQGPEGPPRA